MHPQATHSLPVGEQTLRYRLVRTRRRTVGFMVSTQGVEVRASARTSLREIERALRQHLPWLQAKMQKFAEKAATLSRGLDKTNWKHGGWVMFRGEEYLVQCRVGAKRRAQVRCVAARGLDDVATLHVEMPVQDGAADCAEATSAAVETWLRQRAREVLLQRLEHFAPLVGVRFSKFRLSSAKTRWGSASTSGTVSLHWRLVQLALAEMDYVVVHELCHFLEMNHSARFWKQVERVMPDYKEHRRALKQSGLSLHT